MSFKVLNFIIQIAVLLFAVSIHESAHGWMAEKWGDPTARYQGRITLNPIAHIDLFGSIILPLLLALMGGPVFGWAKPVIVNPYNLRNPRKANIFISAAGPGSNLIAAFLSTVIFLILKHFGVFGSFIGSNFTVLVYIFFYMIIINIYLMVFNLIPIPPLDGSGILEGMLKGEAYYQYQKIKPFGFLILLVIIYTGVLNRIANPIILFVMKLLQG